LDDVDDRDKPGHDDEAFDDGAGLSEEARLKRIGASRRQRLEMPQIGGQDHRIERSSRRRDRHVREARMASDRLRLVRQRARDRGRLNGGAGSIGKLRRSLSLNAESYGLERPPRGVADVENHDLISLDPIENSVRIG
jgi:hypothetical protein